MTKYFFFFLLFLAKLELEGASLADLSYLVADCKYSRKEGLKICEVQQGCLSALKGDLYASGGNGTILPQLAHFFEDFPLKKWFRGPFFVPLKKTLQQNGWQEIPSLRTLFKDPLFLECALKPPKDPFSLLDYSAICYASFEIVREKEVYQKAYPGCLFIDAVTLPYWVDKYKMNALFNKNEELQPYKAEWRLYPKIYRSSLSHEIQKDMPSQRYVIKPRGEFLAIGVIVVEKENLDNALQLILGPKEVVKNHPERNYSYWAKNKDTTFLIEKYYASDSLYFEHALREEEAVLLVEKGNYQYDATIRIAFILKYDKGRASYHSLGGFWKLPLKALEEEGTLNEKSISLCAPPFYRKVEEALFKEIDSKLEKAMLLLYEEMLR